VAGQWQFPGYPQLSKLQTGNGQWDIRYWLLAAGYRLSSIVCERQTTNHQPQTKKPQTHNPKHPTPNPSIFAA
jgi:hypothetical protein